MIKKISKFLLVFLLVISTFSSLTICYADVNGDKTKSVEATDAVTTSETTESNTEVEEEIYSGDLYLFDNDIVMDKLVDGNVFIFGNNVDIKGQINGNLFVFANNVSFDEKSYVRYTIFACANSIYYNGACNDLYAATNNLEMTYASYVIRDVKTVSSNVILKAAVGRDVDLYCKKASFGEGEDIPVIYGNLRYSAPSKLSIPDGVINGEGSATNISNGILETIADIMVGFLTCIITSLIIYMIIKKVNPNFTEKLSKESISVIKMLKAFGIGIATTAIVSLSTILLLIVLVGTKLAVLLLSIFAVLCLISLPILAIIITNILKPSFKIEKTSMFYLVLSLVSIILYGVTLIPYAGIVLGFIIKMIAIGLLVDMFLPHKELSKEEKEKLEETKKQLEETKKQPERSEESNNNNKKKKTIFIVVGTILLILLVVIVISLPRLILGYRIFESSSDIADSVSSKLDQTLTDLEAITQESLNNTTKDTTN